MKKQIIAAAVAVAVAAPAMAQVTMSGSVSVGVSNNGTATQSVTKLGNGANFIGFAASDDLGGGLKGGVVLQTRFDPQTGGNFATARIANGGALVDTSFWQSNVYLSGAFGSVAVGTIAEDNLCGYEVFGCTGGGQLKVGSTTNSMASSVKYVSPSIMGFTLSHHQTISAGIAVERKVTHARYATGPFAVSYWQANGSGTFTNATTDNIGGLGNAAAAAADTSTETKQQSWAASYNAGFATLAAVTTTAENAAGTRTESGTTYNVAAPLMGKWTVRGGVSKDNVRNSAGDDKWAVGVKYDFSKRTNLRVDSYKDDSQSQNGWVIGMQHTF